MASQRSNPLFVDSTKPVGDKVVAQVELHRICLYDEENVFMEVKDQFDLIQKFPLSPSSDGSFYSAEVWLKYQHEIEIRFVIEADSNLLFLSDWTSAYVGHVLTQLWEPFLTGKQLAIPKQSQQGDASGFLGQPLVVPKEFVMREFDWKALNASGSSHPLGPVRLPYVEKVKELLDFF